MDLKASALLVVHLRTSLTAGYSLFSRIGLGGKFLHHLLQVLPAWLWQISRLVLLNLFWYNSALFSKQELLFSLCLLPPWCQWQRIYWFWGWISYCSTFFTSWVIQGLCDEPVHPVAGVAGGQAGLDIQPVRPERRQGPYSRWAGGHFSLGILYSYGLSVVFIIFRFMNWWGTGSMEAIWRMSSSGMWSISLG